MIKFIITISCFLAEWVLKKIVIFRTKEEVEKNKDDYVA